MFEKKKTTDSNNDSSDVFRPMKGSAKVIIGNGVTLKGEITKADEVQIDGDADITVKADNLIVGTSGHCKGTVETHNADIWGVFDGDIKASGTLTVQEEGNISGSIEYQSLQIKLGGKVSGEIKLSDKIKPIKEDVKNKEVSSNKSLQEAISKEK